MEKDINQEILERLVRLETKLDNYNGLREKLEDTATKTDVHDEQFKNIDSRLSKMESNQTWLWRTIAGALILGAISALIAFK